MTHDEIGEMIAFCNNTAKLAQTVQESLAVLELAMRTAYKTNDIKGTNVELALQHFAKTNTILQAISVTFQEEANAALS